MSVVVSFKKTALCMQEIIFRRFLLAVQEPLNGVG